MALTLKLEILVFLSHYVVDHRLRTSDRSCYIDALISGVHRQCVRDSGRARTPQPAILFSKNMVTHSASRCAVSVRDREDAVVGRHLTRFTRKFELELVAIGNDNRHVINDIDGEIGVTPAEIDGDQALTVVFVLSGYGMLAVSSPQLSGSSHRGILVFAACKASVCRCWGDWRSSYAFVMGAVSGGAITLRLIYEYQHPFICKCDPVCMPAIAEFSTPAEDFALRETLERRPDLEFEVDRVVAHDTAHVMPFVWVSSEELEDLTSILEADPSVETVNLLSEDDSGAEQPLLSMEFHEFA